MFWGAGGGGPGGVERNRAGGPRPAAARVAPGGARAREPPAGPIRRRAIRATARGGARPSARPHRAPAGGAPRAPARRAQLRRPSRAPSPPNAAHLVQLVFDLGSGVGGRGRRVKRGSARARRAARRSPRAAPRRRALDPRGISMTAVGVVRGRARIGYRANGRPTPTPRLPSPSPPTCKPVRRVAVGRRGQVVPRVGGVRGGGHGGGGERGAARREWARGVGRRSPRATRRGPPPARHGAGRSGRATRARAPPRSGRPAPLTPARRPSPSPPPSLKPPSPPWPSP